MQTVLARHAEWVGGEPDGRRANLSGRDLRGANLGGANLREADLWNAVAVDQARNWHEVKLDAPEQAAMARLKMMIPPAEYQRYVNYGVCYVEGAWFSRNELVQLPDGWYCMAVQSAEPLPPTDRLMHRILWWRKGEAAFKTKAERRY